MLEALSHYSSIHPIYHATCLRSSISKVLWMFYCVFLIVVFNVAIYFLVVRYDRLQHDRIQWVEQEEFPQVVICPSYWIDIDRARDAGLDGDLLQYTLGFTGTLAHETDIRPYDNLPFYELWKQDSLKQKFDETVRNHSTLSDLLKNISLQADSVAVARPCLDCPGIPQITPIVKSGSVCYALSLSDSDEKKPKKHRKVSFSLFPRGGPHGMAQLLFGPSAMTEQELNSVIVRQNVSYDITLRAFGLATSKKHNLSDYLTCEQRCLRAIEEKHEKRIRFFMGEIFDEPRAEYVHGSDESWLSADDLKAARLASTECRAAKCTSSPVAPIFDIVATSYTPSAPLASAITVRLGLGGKEMAIVKPNFRDLWIMGLADFGGLLALFFGASVTSLLHFIYSIFAATGGSGLGGKSLLPRRSGSVTPSTPQPEIAPVENGLT